MPAGEPAPCVEFSFVLLIVPRFVYGDHEIRTVGPCNSPGSTVGKGDKTGLKLEARQELVKGFIDALIVATTKAQLLEARDAFEP